MNDNNKEVLGESFETRFNKRFGFGIWRKTDGKETYTSDVLEWIRKELDLARSQERRELLLTVMNVLTDKWDRLEFQDPDTSTEKWMNYKHIRNNIRDTIKEIAEAKGVNLTH